MVCGQEVIEVAHGEQALGEGVGSAHGWFVCLVDGVASIAMAGRQLRSDGGTAWLRSNEAVLAVVELRFSHSPSIG